jgi:hypothetical protein
MSIDHLIRSVWSIDYAEGYFREKKANAAGLSKDQFLDNNNSDDNANKDQHHPDMQLNFTFKFFQAYHVSKVG